MSLSGNFGTLVTLLSTVMGRKSFDASETERKSRDVIDSTRIELLLDRYAANILGEPEPTSQAEHGKCSTETTMIEQKAEDSYKKEPEVVVFNSRPKSNQLVQGCNKMTKLTASEHRETKNSSKFTNGRLNSSEVLKKLQFDVGSFGMKALSKEQQREQEKRRAIRLGAKPTKRKSTNYKEYIEERKRVKQTATDNAMRSKEKKSRTKNLPKPKFWKEGNKSLSAQVGKYRDGVLKLSSKDIKSISKRR